MSQKCFLPEVYSLALSGLWLALSCGSHAAAQDLTGQVTPSPTVSVTPTYAPPRIAVEMKKAPAFFPRLKSTDFPKYVKSAFSAFEKGNYKKALELAKKAPRGLKRPANLDKVLFLEALAHQGLGQHKDALSKFKASRQLRASNSDLHFFEGLSQLAAGDQDKAIAALNDALWFGRFTAISPAEVNLYLGNLYKLKGDSKRALSAYTLAATAKPPLPAVSAELAAMQLETGSRAQAIKTLRDARAAHPEDVDLQIGLANALLYKADRILNANEIGEARRITNDLLKQSGVKGAARSRLWPVYLQALIGERKFDVAEKSLAQAQRETTGEDRARVATLAEQIQIEKGLKE